VVELSGDVKKSTKKDKSTKKKKNKANDTEAWFGTDLEQKTFHIDPADATQERLLEEFNMSIIKYIVSDDNDSIFVKDGKFKVKAGSSYIVVGIPVGHSLCGRCNKEYDIEHNDPKQVICRYHPGNWTEIEIEVKEFVEEKDDVEKSGSASGEEEEKKKKKKKKKKQKVIKSVLGWDCCQALQINQRGCTKAGGHTEYVEKIDDSEPSEVQRMKKNKKKK